MLFVAAAVAAAAAVAVALYVREGLGWAGMGMAALRVVGLGALLVLLIDPSRSVEEAAGPPTVLLDASLSMSAVAGGWRAALDSARATAGDGGTILRFGRSISPFDTLGPRAGTSRLAEALRAARGRGGPVVVITDGELDDWHGIPPSVRDQVGVRLLPRDTAPEVALLEAVVPARVRRDDSLTIELTLGTWGATPTTGRIEVFAGHRRLVARDVDLPPSPGTARRAVTLPPRTLPAATHVLRVRLRADGDREPRTDERLRPVTVTEQAAVVIVVDPADWEGRFLLRLMDDVAQAPVAGYARVSATTWLDMRTQRPVSAGAVRAAARDAGVVVLRGTPGPATEGAARRPVWRWPAGSDRRVEFFAGDWYVARSMPASPVAAALAAIPWDSLPPLSGLVPFAPSDDEWIGLTARQGRRGAERPVLVGRDSAGHRELVMAGEGAWRWALRGGAALEAYRSLLAAGLDWLLGSDAELTRPVLSASEVVTQGVPVMFRFRGETPPDSASVTFTGDTIVTAVLRFGTDGLAPAELPPGVYRWRAASLDASGLTVVEEYSDELHPRPVVAAAARGGAGTRRHERRARGVWWLFVLAGAALVGEWAWRQRRGLP